MQIFRTLEVIISSLNDMKSILKKLFLGNLSKVEKPVQSSTKTHSKHQGDLEQQPPKRQWNRKTRSIVPFLLATALSGSLHQIFGLFKRIRISGFGLGFLCIAQSELPVVDFNLPLAKLLFRHLDNDLCIARNRFVHSHLDFCFGHVFETSFL